MANCRRSFERDFISHLFPPFVSFDPSRLAPYLVSKAVGAFAITCQPPLDAYFCKCMSSWSSSEERQVMIMFSFFAVCAIVLICALEREGEILTWGWSRLLCCGFGGCFGKKQRRRVKSLWTAFDHHHHHLRPLQGEGLSPDLELYPSVITATNLFPQTP